MTGYGRGQAQIDGLSFAVEIKAVNHRYGDISVRAPRLLAPLEVEIKKQVANVLKRGKIDIYISQNNNGTLAAAPVVDERMARAYLAAIAQLKAISGLPGEIGLEFLAEQKDVLLLQDAEFELDDLRHCLQQALAAALEAIQLTRSQEGEATARDISARLERLTRELRAVEAVAATVPQEWQKKLQERLARLDENGGDPQRIAQEIAIFADRSDISEEISRFHSHLEQFAGLLQDPEPVGRQLDFLVQELNREANTMGSKSNDAILTRHVVTLKSELEKIREQVQNIE
jgi:uncharacterized protein (TIGR00255 family)